MDKMHLAVGFQLILPIFEPKNNKFSIFRAPDLHELAQNRNFCEQRFIAM